MAKEPHKVPKSALCRSYVQTNDQNLRYQIHTELNRRGIHPATCHKMVQDQNNAAAALAAVAVIGAAVAVCSNNNCGGGSSGYGYAWDQFQHPNAFGLMWACRSRATGQFADNYHCNGLAMHDNTWPGMYL